MRERVFVTVLCHECGTLMRFAEGLVIDLAEMVVAIQAYCPECGAHASVPVQNRAPGNKEDTDDR